MQTKNWKTTPGKFKKLTFVIINVTAFCKFFVMNNCVRICERNNMNAFVRNNGDFSVNWH